MTLPTIKKILECSPELIIPELVPLEENPICDLAEGIEIHEPDPILLEPDHVEGVAGEGEAGADVLLVAVFRIHYILGGSGSADPCL